MLTAARVTVLRHAWAPSTRALPRSMVASVAALAVAPLVITSARGGTVLAGAVTAAAVISAALVAFAADDPAAEVLAATPVPLGERRLLRLAALLLVAIAVALVVGAVVEWRDPQGVTDVRTRLAEFAAGAGLAFAVAGAADRHELRNAAATGALAGPVAILVVSAFSQRYHWLPMVGQIEHDGVWWLIAAGAWSAGMWTSRDVIA